MLLLMLALKLVATFECVKSFMAHFFCFSLSSSSLSFSLQADDDEESGYSWDYIWINNNNAPNLLSQFSIFIYISDANCYEDMTRQANMTNAPISHEISPTTQHSQAQWCCMASLLHSPSFFWHLFIYIWYCYEEMTRWANITSKQAGTARKISPTLFSHNEWAIIVWRSIFGYMHVYLISVMRRWRRERT